MKVREFEVSSGVKGFVQEEGVLFSEWVIYEKSGWFGNKQVGSVDPKEDELRKFLEKKYGKPVKIWWGRSCVSVPTFFYFTWNWFSNKYKQ